MAEQKKSVGALWCREAKSGTKYYSGILELNEGEKIAIVAFRNTKKQDKQPDWRIYLSDPPANGGGSAPAPKAGAKPAPKAGAKAASKAKGAEGAAAGDAGGETDDIPF